MNWQKELELSEEVRAITEAAMRGEIDFKESFKNVFLFGRFRRICIARNCRKSSDYGWADRLMHILKKCGYKIAILSGGFTFFGKISKKRFGVDYLYANELEIKDGKLTGKHLGDIVDGNRKAELLKFLAQVEKYRIGSSNCCRRRRNDLLMLNIGLGIAFSAKPKVKENARQSISSIGLDGVLYFLGFRDKHINEDFRIFIKLEPILSH